MSSRIYRSFIYRNRTKIALEHYSKMCSGSTHTYTHKKKVVEAFKTLWNLIYFQLISTGDFSNWTDIYWLPTLLGLLVLIHVLSVFSPYLCLCHPITFLNYIFKWILRFKLKHTGMLEDVVKPPMKAQILYAAVCSGTLSVCCSSFPHFTRGWT